MKENSQSAKSRGLVPRRDPENGGGVTNQDIRVEGDAEAKNDAPTRSEASRSGNEQGDEQVIDRGRRKAETAGGNGEQRSREHARVKSVAVVDFEEGPAPFVRQESADHETPADEEAVRESDGERKAESAIAASGRDRPSTTGANADPRTRRQDPTVTGSAEKAAEINRPSGRTSSPSRTSDAPFSQSGARISDFEGAHR